MKRPRVTVTASEVSDHTIGVCLACGNKQDGVEPDAERYQCENCDRHLVYGCEQALLCGLVDLADENSTTDDDSTDDTPM